MLKEQFEPLDPNEGGIEITAKTSNGARPGVDGAPRMQWYMCRCSTRFAAWAGPNTALEATGHSERFWAGVGLCSVARASAWAFGITLRGSLRALIFLSPACAEMNRWR